MRWVHSFFPKGRIPKFSRLGSRFPYFQHGPAARWQRVDVFQHNKFGQLPSQISEENTILISRNGWMHEWWPYNIAAEYWVDLSVRTHILSMRNIPSMHEQDWYFAAHGVQKAGWFSVFPMQSVGFQTKSLLPMAPWIVTGTMDTPYECRFNKRFYLKKLNSPCNS